MLCNSCRLPARFVTANGESVKIDIAKMEDLEDCCAFGRAMFRTKPIRLFLTDEAVEKMEFVRPWTINCLNSKVSLVARNSDGAVVAARMTQFSTVENPTQMPKELIEVGHVLRKLNEGVNIFEMYKIKRLIHFAYLGVHPDYRRQGLVEKMFEISIELAKMKGAEAIIVDGINNKATKAALRGGFKVVRTLNVSALKDNISQQNYEELMAVNSDVCLLIRSIV